MAWSSYQTLLPLNSWATLMGIDLYSFNQIGLGFPEGAQIGIGADCQSVLYQSEYQYHGISRDEIAKAIAASEDMLAKRLGFYPAPKFIVNEKHQYPQSRSPYAFGKGAWGTSILWGVPQYPTPALPSVQLQFGKVLGSGVFGRTLIGTAAVTISDQDNDGIDDTFTATIATTVTDTDEIAAYFVPTDRVPQNNPVSETWRLRPLTVTISGGNATIVGHSTLLVLPNLQTIVNPQPLDVTDPLIYAGSIEVYRVYLDTSNQGTAYWEQIPCTDTTIPPCDLQTQAICIGDRNSDRGQVFASFPDANCCVNWRAPDKVTINYVSGFPLVNGDVDSDFARMIAYLSSGWLPNQRCGCERSDRIISFWRQDLKQSTPEGIPPQPFTDHQLRSPFGFTRGALYAWDRVDENQQYTGVSI